MDSSIIEKLCMSFYSGEQESEFHLPEQCLFCGAVLYNSKWDICECKYSKFYNMETIGIILMNYSSGSGGRGEKHEIYAGALGGHLFYDLFLKGLGGMTPLDPLLN